MTTSELINLYLAARRAHGTMLKTGARVLHQFARETGNVPLADVSAEAVATFLRGHGELSATWRTRYGCLTGLYRYAMARGHVTEWALPQDHPKFPPQITPYVYSRDELQRLLDATDILESLSSPLQAQTYRTLLLLLYATGLRVSEALKLTLEEVNLCERVLTVRETKFYKSRLVPFGVQLAIALAKQMERRSTLPMPQGSQSAFLSSRSGHRLSYERVHMLFQRVRARARITCLVGQKRPPRLHDLRYSAAVHRVVAWYRDGLDVQKLLPQLATYLGHIDIASTQRYLQMTPELLAQASARFAAYADIDVREEDSDARS